MNRTMAWMALVALAASWMLAGCDNPEPNLKTPEGSTIKVATISPTDETEITAVSNVETARADYIHRLEVLRDYYSKMGNVDKNWMARNELLNVESAQAFSWMGFKATIPKGESLDNVDDRLLVEEMSAARKTWTASLEELAAYYKRKNDTTNFRLVETTLMRYDPVRVYTYIYAAEIPGPELRPTTVIPEADKLYDQAYKMFTDGKGALHFFVTTDYRKERQAIVLFRQLIEKYPNSTKIALSAYYIADILKEYFNEDIRSVHWYERAWQWDPHITEPARFQAATVYDYRLADYKKAIECYKASLKDDPWRVLNPEHARNRINELQKEMGKQTK